MTYLLEFAIFIIVVKSMKRGFTLIELLGAILILSAIVLIVAPLILNQINKGKEIVDKQSEESLVLSAQS